MFRQTLCYCENVSPDRFCSLSLRLVASCSDIVSLLVLVRVRVSQDEVARRRLIA